MTNRPLPDAWRVTSINVAAESGNEVHDDDSARRLGYDGALVAGVTTYGYLVRQVVAALGDDWLDRGTLEVRLRQPAYDGDEFTVSVEDAPLSSIRVSAVRDRDGAVVATADASTGAPGPLPARAHPLTPDLPHPYPPTRDALDGVDHLPSVDYTIDQSWQDKLTGDVANDLDVFEDRGIVHPVVYGDLANVSFMKAVAVGPWIHARSRVRHHRPLFVGETVSVRPRIDTLTTTGRSELLTLDTAIVVDDLLVARVEHSVIYAMTERPA